MFRAWCVSGDVEGARQAVLYMVRLHTYLIMSQAAASRDCGLAWIVALICDRYDLP